MRVMKSSKIADDAGAVTRVVILDFGEEAFVTLTNSVNEAGLTASSLTALASSASND